YFLWKFIRKSVLSQNGVNFSIMFAGHSENFNNASKRRISFFWPIFHCYQYFFTIFCTVYFILRNKNICVHFIIRNVHKGEIFLHLNGTDEFGSFSFYNLCYFTFGLSAFFTLKNIHFNNIAV